MKRARILQDLDGPCTMWLDNFDHNVMPGLFPGYKVIDYREAHVFKRGNAPADLVQLGLDTVDYLNLKPVPGSREGIRALQDAGHEVVFASAPTPTHPTNVDDKREWIERYYGPKMAEAAYIRLDKTTIDGDVIIDDKKRITGERPLKPKHILYRMPYNRGAGGTESAVLLNWRWALETVETVMS